ncbi:hypothetical protein [Aminobacter sp. Piv2-1]
MKKLAGGRDISLLQHRQPMLSPAAAKMKELLLEAARQSTKHGTS